MQYEPFVEVTAIVIDHGDPSVGINSVSWEVKCPFYKNEDKENKEFFRQSIAALYAEFAEGRIDVRFDYEIAEENEYYNNAYLPT